MFVGEKEADRLCLVGATFSLCDVMSVLPVRIKGRFGMCTSSFPGRVGEVKGHIDYVFFFYSALSRIIPKQFACEMFASQVFFCSKQIELHQECITIRQLRHQLNMNCLY